MTSTTVGLPDRYRLLDEVGPEEATSTGAIRCWRAKDRVLNRDVAVRVHTPGGSAAHAWITRALTAGGLANPALAMVYDASEGSDDGLSAAYVVNEWIEGETLADRLDRGPLPDRDVRPMMRRLADGGAEAHRVGLAVGGLGPENVVLRPNGLVGLRAVPAATGSIEGDISALGGLLEACLTGTGTGAADAPLQGAPDLVALVRRARSSEAGQSLSSVAAMAALLAERPRPTTTGGRGEDDGRRRRHRDRRPDTHDGPRRQADQATRAVPPAAAPPATSSEPDGEPRPLDPQTRPPVPGSTRPARVAEKGGLPTAPEQAGAGRRGDTVSVSVPPPPDAAWTPPADPRSTGGRGDDSLDDLVDDRFAAADDGRDESGGETATRRRLLVVGLPVLALALVVALAWWFGSSVLSVAGNVDDIEGSTPSASAPADDEQSDGGSATTGEPVEVTGAQVFDPGGDGAPENDDQVPLSFDDDPSTAWPTLNYRGSAAFGNLKDGVGVIYDLGSEQEIVGAELRTTLPGSTVELRSVPSPDGALDDFPVLAEGTLEDTSEFSFEEPATTRYVLVWITELVPVDDEFSADLAEVSFTAAG
jgi:eukaryotic-like serine/threonine-protein kinase